MHEDVHICEAWIHDDTGYGDAQKFVVLIAFRGDKGVQTYREVVTIPLGENTMAVMGHALKNFGCRLVTNSGYPLVTDESVRRKDLMAGVAKSLRDLAKKVDDM